MNPHLRYVILFFFALFFISLNSVAAYPLYQNAKDYKGEILQPVVCCSKEGLRDGLYIGLGVGYDVYNGNQEVSVTDIGGFPDTGNPGFSSNGWLGDLFLGYGRYFDYFYIAGEIFTTYSGANSSFSINHYHSSFSVDSTYGFSIMPGVRVNPLALLYGRLGYSRSYFRITEFQKGVFDSNRTQWGNGLNMGAGLEVALPINFSLRGEYNYVLYQTFRTPESTSFSPADNQFIMSVLYHFDFI